MYSYYNEVTILTVWYFSETVAVGYFGQYKIVPLNSTESYGGIRFFFLPIFFQFTWLLQESISWILVFNYFFFKVSNF